VLDPRIFRSQHICLREIFKSLVDIAKAPQRERKPRKRANVCRSQRHGAAIACFRLFETSEHERQLTKFAIGREVFGVERGRLFKKKERRWSVVLVPGKAPRRKRCVAAFYSCNPRIVDNGPIGRYCVGQSTQVNENCRQFIMGHRFSGLAFRCAKKQLRGICILVGAAPPQKASERHENMKIVGAKL
jgi:hypothetical protein